MTAFAIPLQALQSQEVSVQLGRQPCRIRAYQKSTGFYLDLLVADAPIVTGVLCRDRNRLVMAEYMGFDGDLVFVDLQGNSDPDWTDLGSRFQLTWLV